MNKLLLPSVRVQGYRLFKDLVIPRLGRVNLITGKNNTGKSALLEALRLYCSAGSLYVIRDTLQARHELEPYPPADEELPLDWRRSGYENLFFGRDDLEQSEPVVIGPVDAEERALVLAFTWYSVEIQDDPPLRRVFPVSVEDTELNEDLRPGLMVRWDGEVRNLLLDRPTPGAPGAFRANLPTRSEACVFLTAGGLEPERTRELWDRISLTHLEDEVLAGLRLISPEVERVTFRTPGRGAPREFVKLREVDQPVPLRSLGDGLNRLLGISLALVNARDGVLLVDEVENGIHHTVQYDLWRLVLRLAKALNVQVFATTHSSDCVQAFERAAREEVDEEGVLIRLERRRSGVGATLFDEEELAIVAEEALEVR